MYGRVERETINQCKNPTTRQHVSHMAGGRRRVVDRPVVYSVLHSTTYQVYLRADLGPHQAQTMTSYWCSYRYDMANNGYTVLLYITHVRIVFILVIAGDTISTRLEMLNVYLILRFYLRSIVRWMCNGIPLPTHRRT